MGTLPHHVGFGLWEGSAFGQRSCEEGAMQKSDENKEIFSLIPLAKLVNMY